MLPTIDAFDGVLLAEFDGGLLLFNANSVSITKILPWTSAPALLPPQVQMGPLEMRWIDLTTGQVR